MAVGGKGRSGQVKKMVLTEQQMRPLWEELGNFGVSCVFAVSCPATIFSNKM